MSAKIVIGHGQARGWADDASAVERTDLLAAVRETRMLDLAQRKGYADRDGKLLRDGWLVVADVSCEDLDQDPAVIAYRWLID